MTKQRINIRAIIWRDGKLLAVRHKNKDDSASAYYATPGGGLDPNESLENGLVRELVEETGITPKPGRLLFIQQFPSEREGFDEELEFFFHVENPEDYENIDLGATTHGALELAVCEFIHPSDVEFLLPDFLATIDLEQYVTQVKPVLILSELEEQLDATRI